MNKAKVLDLAREIVQREGKSVSDLINNINEDFLKAIKILLKCEGKVAVAGLGKSGIIGKKIAASFSSLGTPALFVHASEALHGDSGSVSKKDVALLISHSGETPEVLTFAKMLKKVIKNKMISITGNGNCSLAKIADSALVTGVSREADPMNLAPTSSAIATLALGDALAICLSRLKGFDEKKFAFLHPGGALGKRLRKF